MEIKVLPGWGYASVGVYFRMCKWQGNEFEDVANDVFHAAKVREGEV